MRESIISILKKIDLLSGYVSLCNSYSNFESRYNLTKKEVEPIIKSYDANFKYIAKDRVFIKELLYQDYVVRLFISFKGGIVDFSYLIWKEEDSQNYYKGRLATLSELVDERFSEQVQYKSPIATSVDDFEKIIYTFFSFLNSFELELN